MNFTDIFKNHGKIKEVPSVGIYNETFVRSRLVEFFTTLKRSYPDKLHPCPVHRDDLKFFNFSSTQKIEFEKILPDGDYRYERKFFNNDDDNIFSFTVYEKFVTREPSFI